MSALSHNNELNEQRIKTHDSLISFICKYNIDIGEHNFNDNKNHLEVYNLFIETVCNARAKYKRQEKKSEDSSQFDARFNKELKTFDDFYMLFKKCTNELFIKEISIKEMIYRLNSELNEACEISTQTELLFKKLLNENVKLKPAHNEGGQVAKGIIDTIVLKINHLEKNKEVFKKKMTNELKAFGALKFGVPDNLMYLCFESFIKSDFFELKKNAYDIISEMFKNEILASYFNEINDNILNFAERFSKSIDMFLNDFVLSEIVTYEEIINASVCKLKEYDAYETKTFAANCEKTYYDILITLKKHSFEVIKPQIGDKFSGKLNEVIVAESDEHFEKGAVIKVISSGFIIDGKVMKRANVIVCK